MKKIYQKIKQLFNSKISLFVLSGIVLGLLVVPLSALGYSYHANGSAFGPMPKAGELRLFYSTYGAGFGTTIKLTRDGVNIKTLSLSGDKKIIDTGLDVYQGDQVGIYIEDVDGPVVGWDDLKSGNRCGSGLPNGNGGYYAIIDVSNQVNWVNNNLEGEPVISWQCWGDSPEWSGDLDFNDFFIAFSYVPPSIQPPTVDIKANGSDGPVSLTAPADYTLSWTSANAETCSASGSWSGSKAINGSESRNNVSQGSYTYTITCSNSVGSATDSVTVNVSSQIVYPTVDLKINGQDGAITLTAPAYYTLSWTSTNANICSAGNAWFGSKGLSGSESRNNVGVGTYVYTITCSNSYGSASDSVTAYVIQESVPVTLSISKLARDPAITTSINYYENLYMIPGREVEFSLAITAYGASSAENVYLRDSLPAGLVYISGSTTIDGVAAPDGIISSAGIYLGNLLPNQTKTVKFRARLEPNAFFTQSLTQLVNTGYGSGNNASQVSDTANVWVVKQGQVLGAAAVDTGADVSAITALITGIAGALSLSGFQLGRRVYWKKKIMLAREQAN
ncbi:MAG: hypothetical protein AB1721_02745 [Patescibacteria group bacterium]